MQAEDWRAATALFTVGEARGRARSGQCEGCME